MARSAAVSAMIIFLVIGGSVLAFVLSFLNIPQTLTNMVVSMEISRWWVMIIINIVLLGMGCLMDPMGVMVICVDGHFTQNFKTSVFTKVSKIPEGNDSDIWCVIPLIGKLLRYRSPSRCEKLQANSPVTEIRKADNQGAEEVWQKNT